ncbi:MAG TPA: DUF1385 domain-containing protein [Ruminococcus sp.]|nr:DUF1385 domain-containing protein [Ruminococcus sp.]HCR72867.1 DUF1385 domain-containing protein [Ruminococcus sp.]
MDEKQKHKSRIGGQALIEGVMMKGIYTSAMACRLPDGTIDVETWEEKNGKNAPWYRKTPFIRGIFNFVSSLTDGYRCLMKSADKQMTEDSDEELSKLDKWINEHFGEKIMSIVSVISVIFSLVICIFLFKFLPMWISGFLKKFISSTIILTIIEGIIKIGIFVGYLAVTALMKDIKRTYEYHGAEHKTIACYEAGEELTVENVKKYTRFHPRCGTSFIFISLFISIFVFCFITWSNMWARMALQIVLLPVIIGISYELIRIAGRYDNIFTKIISAPGLRLQRLTTREPDGSEIEVAIAAIKPCIPENREEDQW